MSVEGVQIGEDTGAVPVAADVPVAAGCWAMAIWTGASRAKRMRARGFIMAMEDEAHGGALARTAIRRLGTDPLPARLYASRGIN
jgi:hypothetical protein